MQENDQCQVVICFQISIFDTIGNNINTSKAEQSVVVICFQISIFDTIGNNTSKRGFVAN